MNSNQNKEAWDWSFGLCTPTNTPELRPITWHKNISCCILRGEVVGAAEKKEPYTSYSAQQVS